MAATKKTKKKKSVAKKTTKKKKVKATKKKVVKKDNKVIGLEENVAYLVAKDQYTVVLVRGKNEEEAREHLVEVFNNNKTYGDDANKIYLCDNTLPFLGIGRDALKSGDVVKLNVNLTPVGRGTVMREVVLKGLD